MFACLSLLFIITVYANTQRGMGTSQSRQSSSGAADCVALGLSLVGLIEGSYWDVSWDLINPGLSRFERLADPKAEYTKARFKGV